MFHFSIIICFTSVLKAKILPPGTITKGSGHHKPEVTEHELRFEFRVMKIYKNVLFGPGSNIEIVSR